MRSPWKPQDSADVLIGGELSLRRAQGFHWQQDKAEHERKVWQRQQDCCLPPSTVESPKHDRQLKETRCKGDSPWEDLEVKASTLYLAEQGWKCGEGYERGITQEGSKTAWSFKQ